ncbi:uncharacterized protein LOC100744458 isoform X1 [Bombus impatiens]|uniref:Uncharacterized protein LOC100744458 isoform X1 n=1 Tax=Bombus impatiens TaxID=132113 RepID=A0A6P8LI67_BOMIM|nr:uncharacterized protein LOC100744458 isoform X1 [Bombus impatiens]
MAETEQDLGDRADNDSLKPDKLFILKKWNAVAMWSWDVECDTCAICRVQVMATFRFFSYPYSTIKFVPTSKYISRICGITYGVTLHKKQDDRIDRGGDKKSRDKGRTMERIKQERRSKEYFVKRYILIT